MNLTKEQRTQLVDEVIGNASAKVLAEVHDLPYDDVSRFLSGLKQRLLFEESHPEAMINDEFDELACFILDRPRFNELVARTKTPRTSSRQAIMGACMGTISHDRHRLVNIQRAMTEAME